MIDRRESRPPHDPATPGSEPVLDTGDLKEAYRLGRDDERAAQRRRRHPVLMTLTVLAAVVGVTLLALAALNDGSFERAGQVADHNLGVAAERAEPVARDAAATAREALGGTGRTAEPAAVETAPADRPS